MSKKKLRKNKAEQTERKKREGKGNEIKTKGNRSRATEEDETKQQTEGVATRGLNI